MDEIKNGPPYDLPGMNSTEEFSRAGFINTILPSWWTRMVSGDISTSLRYRSSLSLSALVRALACGYIARYTQDTDRRPFRIPHQGHRVLNHDC